MAKEKENKKATPAKGTDKGKKAAEPKKSLKDKLNDKFESFLTFIEKRISFIAIDIGASSIKIVEIDKGNSNLEKVWIIDQF